MQFIREQLQKENLQCPNLIAFVPTYALDLWNTTESGKVTVLVFLVLNAFFSFKVANLIS